jgi:hypothetical protein
MKPSARFCCLVAILVIGLLTSREAHAAPMVFDVTVNRLCDSTSTCHDVALDGYTLTLVFNEDVVYSFGVDISLFNSHVTRFGPPSMSIGGGSTSDLANPFGTVTSDNSGASLSYSENKNPVGPGTTSLSASVNQSHEGTAFNPDGTSQDQNWFYTLSLFRQTSYLTGGDGSTNPVTGADFLHELSIGTFDLTWSSQIFTRDCPATGNCVQLAQWVADPRNFNAFGTATIHAAAEPVPEPASLLLLGAGLMATIYLKRSSNA